MCPGTRTQDLGAPEAYLGYFSHHVRTQQTSIKPHLNLTPGSSKASQNPRLASAITITSSNSLPSRTLTTNHKVSVLISQLNILNTSNRLKGNEETTSWLNSLSRPPSSQSLQHSALMLSPPKRLSATVVTMMESFVVRA